MRSDTTRSFQPDYLVAPGETIAETIEFLGMSQKEFAKRLGITEQSLIRILKALQPISLETAEKLEMVTGAPASFWNSLESRYREALLKRRDAKEFESGQEWLKGIPYKEIVKRGYAAGVSGTGLQVRDALSFYGVSEVEGWKQIWEDPKVAARRSHCFSTDPGAASAWIRIGEIEAQKISCEPYEEKLFRAVLSEIRSLTRHPAERFSRRMVDLCAQAGVALVFVPGFKGVPWNGASKWLSPKKALILLNLRGKYEDKFWFSFFHEASHILNDDKKNLYIADNSQDEVEQRADAFAAEFLIPAQHNTEIQASVSAAQIKRLARIIGVSEGIVAGRWQHLSRCYSRFNELRKKLEYSTSP